jgi:predicted GNAT family acetyltransferase
MHPTDGVTLNIEWRAQSRSAKIFGVPLTVTTEPDSIIAVLDVVLAADPVRATVVGTIRTELARRPADGWCAFGTSPISGPISGSGATHLAVRSDAVYPVVVLGDWPAADLAQLPGVLRTVPALAGVAGDAKVIDTLRPELPRVQAEQAQRLFRLDELVLPTGVEGRARLARTADRQLLIEFFRAFSIEANAGRRVPPAAAAADDALAHGRPWLWCDESGVVVSMAHRRSGVAGCARVGPVYTPPSERGHGYASAVTAAATSDILADGAIPVLFTDLANPISNAIYPRLGYYPVADEVRLHFG